MHIFPFYHFSLLLLNNMTNFLLDFNTIGFLEPGLKHCIFTIYFIIFITYISFLSPYSFNILINLSLFSVGDLLRRLSGVKHWNDSSRSLCLLEQSDICWLMISSEKNKHHSWKLLSDEMGFHQMPFRQNYAFVYGFSFLKTMSVYPIQLQVLLPSLLVCQVSRHYLTFSPLWRTKLFAKILHFSNSRVYEIRVSLFHSFRVT